MDLGHTCDVSIVRLLRLRRRLGLSVLAGFLVAIPLTPLAFSVPAEWDPLRVVNCGFADGLHGMVTHQSWAVAALKAIAIAFHPWVFRAAVPVLARPCARAGDLGRGRTESRTGRRAHVARTPAGSTSCLFIYNG